MERLWSPWRLAYVSSVEQPPCVFCHALEAEREAPLLLFRGESCFIVLNLYPYNNGHLMVVPNRHFATLAEATAEELAELMTLARRSEIALGEVYHPHGLNLGMNVGRPAGAGVAEHVHLHVVPRWTGDTNFMTTIGDVRVLPESMEQTADRLRPVFERLAARSVSR